MKKLSIIIPCYNNWNFTKSCLNDLSKLNDHEIIIVDNGSTDETKNNLENNKTIKYIRFDKNLGFGKACNVGYEVSTSDNVLFLNNDIKVIRDYDTWTSLLLNKCSDGLVGPTMGKLDKYFNFIRESNEVLNGLSYMSGWCLASSKSYWEKLKIKKNQIFDETFFCYFEDTDLSFRARELNISFNVVKIPVVHFGKQTSSKINTYKLYSSSKDIFIKKWKKLYK